MVLLIVVKDTCSGDLFRNETHFATVGRCDLLALLLRFKIHLNQNGYWCCGRTWHFRTNQSPSRDQQREIRLLHMLGGFADHSHTVSVRKRG
jgi:hypothetical protein